MGRRDIVLLSTAHTQKHLSIAIRTLLLCNVPEHVLKVQCLSGSMNVWLHTSMSLQQYKKTRKNIMIDT